MIPAHLVSQQTTAGRIVEGPGSSSSGATIASLVLAIIAGIVLVVFRAAPSVMIGFTKWADRHRGAVAAA